MRGWLHELLDLGEVNHSWQCFEPVLGPNGKRYYNVLDEVVHIGQQVSTEEFTWQVMERMRSLELHIGHRVVWRHWSDSQALYQFKAGINGYDAMLVQQASKGEIFLQGVPKEPGCVQKRVQLIKKLLLEDRLFISANCLATRRMLAELRKGRTDTDYVARSNNPHKHPFDSLSYGLQMECIYEIETTSTPQTGSRSGLILAA